MSLPLPWVDKIFSKLTLVYGRDFIGRWEGLELADVKTDWSHELAGFENFPEGIAFALQNMPANKPPTVLEFKAIALKAPKPAFKMLEAPKADPARVAAELAKLGHKSKDKRMSIGSVDPKGWAKALQAKDEAGEKMNPTIRRFCREALRLDQPVLEA